MEVSSRSDEDLLELIAKDRDGEAFAHRTGARLVSIEAGHAVHARKPVQVNIALREFVQSLVPAREPEHGRV